MPIILLVNLTSLYKAIKMKCLKTFSLLLAILLLSGCAGGGRTNSQLMVKASIGIDDIRLDDIELAYQTNITY